MKHWINGSALKFALLSAALASLLALKASAQISPSPPFISTAPNSQTATPGGSATFSVSATGTSPLSYQWRKDGVAISGATNAILTLNNAQITDAASYTVIVTNSIGSITSSPATLTVNSLVIVLVGISSLVSVPSEGITAYFRIEGTGTKQVLIRGVGPTLSGFGLAGAMADPRVDLSNETGAIVATNDNWDGSAALSAAFSKVGIIALVRSSRDAAMLVTLPPGFYSVRLSGVGGTTGEALINIYDMDISRSAAFTYLALRGPVGPEGRSPECFYSHPLGASPKTFVVRAAGPALAQAGALSDPVLELSIGSGTTSNDNWESSVSVLVTTPAIFGAIPFAAGSKDSALVVSSGSSGDSLSRIKVSGVAGATGVALVEIFDTGASPAPRAPFVLVAPAAQNVTVGQVATLSIAAGGTGTLSYQWRKNGATINGATSSSYTFTAQTVDAGSYTVAITNSAGSVTSSEASLTVNPANPARLINLSILTSLNAGESFSMGFVVGGSGTSGSKPLLMRAAGPSLAQLSVTGAHDDPKIEFFTGANKVNENDNWGGAAATINAFAQVGAFAYVSATSKDAAIFVPAVARGDNSVRVSGVGNAGGTVIAELYDATAAASFTITTPRLVNVSVLKDIGSGLTAGFVIGGAGSKTVLIRAVGPALAIFSVGNAIADPRLTLFNSSGVIIGSNDNWLSADSGTMTLVGAFALPASSRDAALVTTLAAGNYTVQVSGVGGTTGVALVEVYEVP